MHNQKKIGVILNYIAEGIQLLSALLYTPIMLRILGQSEYGLYQLVSSVVSYLSLFSLGFTSSYIRFYSRYKIKNDRKGIASLNGLFMTLFICMSGMCIICGVFMTFNLEVIFGSGLSAKEYETARILLIMLVMAMAITFPNSVFECQITAHEEFVFLQGLNVAQKILNPFITLPLLILGYGSVAIVTVSLVLTLIKFIANLLYTRKKLNAEYDFKKMNISLLKEVSGFTIFIFINQIVDQINWNLDKFLLGRMLGTESVAIYGVSSTIYTAYITFANSVKTVFVPQINLLVAEESNDRKITDLFIKVGRIQMMLTLLIFLGFLFFGKVFIYLWAGEEYINSYYVVMLLMGPMVIPLSQSLGVEIQRAKNKHQMRTVVYLCIAILNVLISIPLIKMFGTVGAAIGTAIAVILGNVIFMNIYYKIGIGLDMKDYWKSCISFFPTFALSFVAGIILSNFYLKYSWVSLLVCIILFCSLYFFMMWIFTMNIYEKQLLLNYMSSIKKKFKGKR